MAVAKRARSAKTGKFVTHKFAKSHKATTVEERVKSSKPAKKKRK